MDKWEGLKNLDRQIVFSKKGDFKLDGWIIFLPKKKEYDEYNFSGKLEIRFGHSKYHEWKFQIKYMDERFRYNSGDINEHGNIYSSGCPDIDCKNKQIHLLGCCTNHDDAIITFKANKKQIEWIFRELYDWAQNWEGWND